MRFNFIDPQMVMGVIIALIIFAVGMFAFFVTMDAIPIYTPSTAPSSNALYNATYYAVMNTTQTANQVFNIVGVIMIIGAIMAIVGVVYSYIRPGSFGG